MSRIPARRLPLLLIPLLLAGACSGGSDTATPTPDADTPPAADTATQPDPAPAATDPEPGPAAEPDTTPPTAEPEATPDVPAAGDSDRGTPEELKKWGSHMGDIPFVVGTERGLAASAATGKPVFLFYTATW